MSPYLWKTICHEGVTSCQILDDSTLFQLFGSCQKVELNFFKLVPVGIWRIWPQNGGNQTLRMPWGNQVFCLFVPQTISMVGKGFVLVGIPSTKCRKQILSVFSVPFCSVWIFLFESLNRFISVCLLPSHLKNCQDYKVFCSLDIVF